MGTVRHAAAVSPGSRGRKSAVDQEHDPPDDEKRGRDSDKDPDHRRDEVEDDREDHGDRDRCADVSFEDRVEQMLRAWIHELCAPDEVDDQHNEQDDHEDSDQAVACSRHSEQHVFLPLGEKR